MVVDTTYYDALQLQPDATELEVKKAYRRLAVKLHPDKNPGDEEANLRFQTIGEAYQVLSDPQLRAAYDKYGKEMAVPSSGFEDPAEFFNIVFGGEAFVDWIGEISLMKDLTKTMDITMQQAEEEEKVRPQQEQAQQDSKEETKKPTTSHTTSAADSAQTEGIPFRPKPATAEDAHQEEAPPPQPPRPTATETSPAAENPYSQQRPQGVPVRPAIMYRSDEEARMDAAGVTEEEKELLQKEKRKGGLTKEQREELAAYELERKRIRDERVNILADKLIARISVWTETDHSIEVTKAFQEKTRLEIENLKMESFGIDILHAIGATYLSKATGMLKSQKLFGISGFWSRLKDKGNLAKETWGTISTSIDAQMSMEEMAKAEERGGDDWTDERRVEYEKRVTGKILAAAWRWSKFEIQSVLRDVCDKVLNDKHVRLEKRFERAQAMIMIADQLKAAKRDPDEEGDYLVFEQLVAEAQVKRGKDHHHHSSKSGSKKDKKSHAPGTEKDSTKHRDKDSGLAYGSEKD